MAYQIEQTASGVLLGVYEGETEAEALDSLARDAGYKSWDDQIAQVGEDGDDTLKLTPVPGTQTMATQYNTPPVSSEWAEARETHIAVATAIHAISNSSRSPKAIMDIPTQAEWEHVAMVVETYIANGVFPAEDDGRYPWWGDILEISLCLQQAPKFQAPSWVAKFHGETIGYFATAVEAQAAVDAKRAELELED